ncbi:hypothetical protein HDU82_008330 [Entophlyctis luteolus]|nr:hypothetical protein HDU82_008330 [Entophlyctis luteolus]
MPEKGRLAPANHPCAVPRDHDVAIVPDRHHHVLQLSSSSHFPTIVTEKSSSLPVTNSQPRRRTWQSFLLAAAAIASVIYGCRQLYNATDSHGTLIRYKIINYYDALFGGYGSDRAKFACSSHGVVVTGGRCICDLGYMGADCSVESPKVLEEFGTLGSSGNALGQSYSELALALAKTGFKVSVLFIGPQNPFFYSNAASYATKGIILTSLTDSGLNFADNSFEATSYNVYQYFLQSRTKFSHVYFSATSGVAYYTLVAQQQGLLCSNTVYINGMDSLTAEAAVKIESGDASAMLLDKDLLKLDFFQRKSAQLADINVMSSNAVFDSLIAAGWEFNKENAHIIHKPAPKIAVHKSASTLQHASVHEIVFVGPMTHAGGLKVFCDAIDHLVTQGLKPTPKITFLGSRGTINDLSSDEYVDLRSLNWDAADLAWAIHTADSLDQIQEYLTAQPGRLAVLPTLSDPTGTLAHALIAARVPLLVSAANAAVDVLAAADRRDMVVHPSAEIVAAKIKNALLTRELTFVHFSSACLNVDTDASPVAKIAPPSPLPDWLKIFEIPANKRCRNRFDTVKDDQPLVSVVVVHHNRHHFLKQTLSSLKRQTYKNMEVIVIDDGSDDPLSLAYAHELSWKWWHDQGWRIVFEPNRYLGAARNAGARAASGQYILFLDDDDYSKPHHVETLVKVAINTDADIVTAGHDVFTGRKRPTSAVSSSRFVPIGSAPLVGLMQNVFGDSAMMIRSDYFAQSGGFTEDFNVGFEDYEFLARASLHGANLQAVPEPLHWYRHHGASMSSTTNLKTNQLRMLRPYIDANPTATPAQRAVFDEVQRVFFEKFGVSFNENPFSRRDNSTVVPVTPLLPGAVNCASFLDVSGASAVQYSEQEVWTENVKAACWNMGTASPLSSANPAGVNVNQAILPTYPDGTAAGYPIVQSVPCDSQYSDVWNLMRVIVAQNTPYNTYKSFGALLSTNAPSFGYFNRPLVPPNSTFSSLYSSNPPTVLPGWANGGRIYFADFGPVPGAFRSNTTVPAGAIVGVKENFLFVKDDRQISSKRLSTFDPTNATGYVTGDFRMIEQLSYPYVPTAVLYNGTQSVVNCPFVAAESTPTYPSAHNTYLYGLQPEITTKSVGVMVVLWGMNFRSNSVVYVNGTVCTSGFNFINSSYIAVTVDFTQYAGNTGFLPITVDDSAPYIIRYYKPFSAVIGVNSNVLYTNTYKQVITISGANLPLFSGALCVFNFTSKGTASPMTITGSTTASCPLPRTLTSGVYSISFAVAASKFDLPQLGLIKGNYYQYPLLTTATTFSVPVYAKGPVAVSAKFSNSGASIYVDLDSQATVIDVNKWSVYGVLSPLDLSSAVPCSAIFQTAATYSNTAPTTGKLSAGVSGDCLVQQLTGTRLKIQLQAQFTAYDPSAVVPGQLITVLSGSLWATQQALCKVQPSSVVITPPDVVPTPAISIVAPVVLPRCDGVVLSLDMTATSGSAGRNYSAAGSSLTASSTSPASDYSVVTALNTLLASCLADINHQAVCQIPVAMLWMAPSGYQVFTFNLTLTNYLGGSASQSVQVSVSPDGLVPLVSVVGVPTTGAKINQIQTITALGSLACGIYSPILYQWTVSGASCPGLSATPVVSNASQIVIPPYTLKPLTTCSVSLQVKYASQPTWFSATPAFTTAAEIIQVSAGSSRTVGSSENIIMDAMLFSDSFVVQANPQFQCLWTCTNSHGFICNNAYLKQLTGCTGNVLTGTLGVDSYSYKVTVQDTVTGKTATSVAPATISVVSSSVPLVTISMPSETVSPYSDKFALFAVVDSTTVSSIQNLKYSWSACSSKDYSTVDFSNPINFLTNASSSQVLKFSPGILLGDTKYCAAVTVVDGANVGTAHIVFETYEVPYAGFCFLKAASVAQANQPLQYSCPYWAADPSAQPLTFGFYVRFTTSSSWTLIAPTTRSSMLNSSFVTGNYQLKAVVTDQYGSSVMGVASAFSGSQELSLSESGSCQTYACAQLATAVADYENTHNSQDAAQAIGSVALLVDPKSPDFETILGFIGMFATDIYIDTTSTGPFLASILQTISGANYSLPASVFSDVVDLVQNIINQITVSGLSQSPVSCVNVLAAESLFLVLDQLMGSSTTLPFTNAERQQSISQFEQSLQTLGTCFSRNKDAEEYPFSFTSAYLTRQIGVAFTDTNSTFCTFNVGAYAAATNDTTISYNCGTQPPKDFPAASGNIAAVDLVHDLTLGSVSSENKVEVSQTTFDLQVTADFQDQYGLGSAVCTFYNTTTGAWSTEGCSVTAVSSNGVVSCSCNHLTAFAVGASQGTSGGLSIGAIIGCVIGAIALVLVTAGSIYQIRKTQQSQPAAAGSLLPTSAPPQTLESSAPPPTAGGGGGGGGGLCGDGGGGQLNEIVTVPSNAAPPPMKAISPAVPLAAAASIGVAAVAAAALAPRGGPAGPKQLPTYSKPPSYDAHVKKMGR